MADYTTIDDPSEYFQAETYTGGGANTSVTFSGNSDLKPDWLWIKNRGADYGHFVVDSTRGISYAQNSSNAPYMEMESVNAENTNQNWMQSVNTDGFTTGISEHINSNSGSTFVAWAWKVNGGTTSSNTDGGLTSTVQVNATAGISIFTFTADGTTNTVGHGLGVKPDVVIYKSRNVGGGWLLITDVLDGGMDYAYINSENAFAGIGYDANTSSVVQYNDNNTNIQVAYAFKQIQGYSKFGRYYGNGNADGTFIYCGFKPAWVMVKNVNSGVSWMIQDNARDTHNPVNLRIKANATAAEASNINCMHFFANGFKTTVNDSSWNTANQYYFYMAFAENPFVTSEGTPTTAR